MIQYGLLSLSHAARLEVQTDEEGNGAGPRNFQVIQYGLLSLSHAVRLVLTLNTPSHTVVGQTVTSQGYEDINFIRQ